MTETGFIKPTRKGILPARVTAVIDGQYGSTGKGAVCSEIAGDHDVWVRVGAPQAGHSHSLGDGEVFVNRSIPVGWVNPDAILVIGRGGLVNPHVLAEEIKAVEKHDPNIRGRLLVDAQCGVVSEWHENEERSGTGYASTREGVGPARRDRIMRDPSKFKHFGDVAAYYGLEKLVYRDTAAFLNKSIDQGVRVGLEGAQGVGLGLLFGHWPMTTSQECGAAQLCSDVGISPHLLTDTLMTMRTMPIRIAGNSGPLKNETTWEAVSERLGRPVSETTTVTKKTRRVGEWDEELVDKSVMLERPTGIALTFADYVNTEDEGVSRIEDLSVETIDFVLYLQERYGVVVRYVGTGGPDFTMVDMLKVGEV